jgi:hypothetical protein
LAPAHAKSRDINVNNESTVGQVAVEETAIDENALRQS